MAWTKSKVGVSALAITLLLGGAAALINGIDADEPSETPDPETAIELAVGQFPADSRPPALVGHDGPGASSGVVDEGDVEQAAIEDDRIVVHGRVHLELTPLERQATVYVIAKDAGPRAEPAARVLCDKDGLFRIEVETVRGHWIVAAGAAGEGFLRSYVDGDAWRGDVLDITLERAPERSFRVLGPDGEPTHAHLTFLPMTPREIRTWPRPGDEELGRWSLSTDEKGKRRLRLPTGRPFIVRAKAQGFVAPPLRVEPDELEIEIRLLPSAIVHVTPDGWKEGDMPLTGRLVPGDAHGEALHAGAQLDGTIVFSDRVLPGDYTLHLHSPNHEEAIVDGVRITHAGQELRVEVPVRLKVRAGSLRVIVERGGKRLGDESPVQLFWRPHNEAHPKWRNRGVHLVESGGISIPGLAEGRHDLYLAARFDGTQAGMKIGAWVRPNETETVTIQLVPATMRLMPDLDDIRAVDAWTLVDEDGTDVPLFFMTRFGSQSYPGPQLPPVRTELGPYPVGPVTLEIEHDGGSKRDVPLDRSR